MNAPERATLRELFAEIGHLSDRIDDRFDGLDERMRSVEQELSANRAVEAVRKEHKVSLRWGVDSVLKVAALSATVSGIVVTVLLRVFG